MNGGLFQGMDRDLWILVHNHQKALLRAIKEPQHAKGWRALARHYKKQLQKV